MSMTPKARAIAALNRQIPDEVPTFELEFQLSEETFGRKLVPDELSGSNINKLSPKEKEKLIFETAEFFLKAYSELDYAIIPGYGPGWFQGLDLSPDLKVFLKRLKELIGETRMIGFHGDGTFAIPDGNEMYEFAYAIADDPDEVKAKADRMANEAIEKNKRLQEAGVECLFLCSDYCYNSGPFVSPAMFGEFIQPYLYKIIAAARKDGLYTIKHTDGNIMPILDQLVDCNPHALHSIDPMAGVDIKEVKRLVGDKVCLCGNVHCAAIQTGSDQEIIDSARYCLTHGKEGGGYIYTTSNCAFKGIPPEKYQLVLQVWKEMRSY